MTYDAIIIGSRCAGAPSAMLLARQGRRVLLVDRATFPSDVLSGHAIQPAGVARLARWGLLERVQATGVPSSSQVRFDFGDVVLQGSPVPVDGIDGLVCIRRTILDPMLTEAAAEAGAEVRLGVTVTELVREGERIVGVRGHDGAGRPVEERSRVVIGADGVHSFVARSVGAPRYHVRPGTTIAAYSYWRGLDLDGLELYARPGLFAIAVPTNDELAFVAVQVPASQDHLVRRRVPEAFADVLAALPHLAGRVAAAERVERFRFAPTVDSFFRQSHGPGWALVGDAGCHKDPITAQGMLDAFRDAELLAGAVHRGLDGDLDSELRCYQQRRDEAMLPMYEFTCGLADLEAPPSPDVQALLARLPGRPDHIARFLGITAGTVALDDFFSPASIGAITGRPLAA